MNTINQSLKKNNFLLISESSAVIVDLNLAKSLNNGFDSRSSVAECFLVVKLFFTYFLD